MRRSGVGLIVIVWIFLSTAYALGADETYTGSLNPNQNSAIYPLSLKAGESILITAESTGGGLDLYLTLKNDLGTLLAENDDRNDSTYDAALGFTAVVDGLYAVTISQYGEGRGSYRLTITRGDESILAPLTDLTAVSLSGPMRTLDTRHFRVHYTQRGEDATNEDFAQAVAQAVEYVYQVQITQLGWPAPMPDGPLGGDERLDVYLMDLLDEDGNGAMGLARSGDQYGDNPNTPEREKFATSSTLRLDNDFAEIIDERLSPIELMRATIAHEFHHAVQHGYDAYEPMNWYFEATAVWMEQAVYPKLSSAAYYVQYVYEYPELCFGTLDDPDGLQMYGEWMFLQSLVDVYGATIIQDLWTNIARLNGFAALQQTLDARGDSLPDAVARYRLQNIVRDYKQAGLFEGSTVWMEDTITDTGIWTPTGKGVQELAANVYQLASSLGTFQVELSEDDQKLELWAMGIRGSQADSFRLGRGAALDADAYDYLYLMVFNPVFQNDVDDCQYSTYSLQVRTVNAADEIPPEQRWSAFHFLPLTG